MGSSIAGGTLDIDIEATDADGEIFSRIELLKNGTVVRTWSPNVTHPHVTTRQDGRQGDDFYVRVYQSGEWAAISSPVFITSTRARSGSRTVARTPGGSGGSAFTLRR
jgi:hypothetical protein